MTAGDEGATRTSAAIWCGSCGIPYAAETVYCANCGAPLAALADVALLVTSEPPAPPQDPLARQGTAADSQPVAPPLPDVGAPLAASVPITPPGVRTLDAAFPAPPRGLLERVRPRQQALSDDEIDAAAAAIIAQARHTERLDRATGAAPEAFALLTGLAPDPVLEEALRQRRDRDRAWLIGGIVCCVLLIVVALIVSRTLSIGILRQ